MDRLVTDAAEQLILIGVAEDLQGSGIEEGDPPRGVDNVQGVGDGRDGPEEHLRILRQLGSCDHAFIVARWPSDRPASPTPGGVQAAATQPASSRNVGVYRSIASPGAGPPEWTRARPNGTQVTDMNQAQAEAVPRPAA